MTIAGSFRTFYLPYCIQKQPCGKYAVLNRRYEQLGDLVSLKITSANAKIISVDGDPSTDSIYLYSDGSVPTRSKKNWTGYEKKLAWLAKLLAWR